MDTEPTLSNKFSTDEIRRLVAPYKIFETAMIQIQTQNIYEKALEKVISKNGLTISQWVVLWTLLTTDKPLSLGQLARFMPIETNSTSVLINKLVKSKLVIRKRSRSDRRSVLLTLTELGETVSKAIAEDVRILQIEVYGVLTEAELAKLTSLTRKVRAAATAQLGTDAEHAERFEKRVTGGVNGPLYYES